MNEFEIIREPSGAVRIYKDGQEIKGAIAYKVEQAVHTATEVTLTFMASKVIIGRMFKEGDNEKSV